MDLFLINRYRDTNEEVDIVDQETKHLQNLKREIEERKKTYVTPKEPNVITLKLEKTAEDFSKIKAQKKKNVSLCQDTVEVLTNAAETSKTSEVTVLNNQISEPEHKKSKIKLSQEFKVLGTSDFEKKSKVQRVLPFWLSHSFSITTNLQKLTCPVEKQTWLNSTLITTLLSEGVTHLFPVQESVIPFVLKEHKLSYPVWPKDICVSAPTGSGKTLSFVLPVIQILMNEIGHHIRALVVLPVQELATQVAKVFKKYCTNTGLRVALLSGSTPLQQEQLQIVRFTESLGWISEVDIIVCTAGRLVEHIQNTDGFSLKHLKFLVIDEADRIMDHIQNDWLYHMDRHIKLENELMTGKVPSLSWSTISKQKSPPHKMLFSATLSQDPEKLEQWGLFQPKLFSAMPTSDFENEGNIRKYTTPEELKEQYVTCSAEQKPLILYHFLAEQKWDRVLCFTNSAQSAHRLAVLISTWGEGKLKVAELSASLNRTKREQVLKQFTNSEINVLIGTDALARGIDVPDCNYVISYDPPRNIKTYIHRVGRTGRAGRIGHAVTILLQNQLSLFKELIQAGGKSVIPKMHIEAEILGNLSKSYETAIQKTKMFISSEIHSKVRKSIDLKRRFKSKPQKKRKKHVKIL